MYADNKTTYDTYDQNKDIIKQDLIKEKSSRVPINNEILNNDKFVFYNEHEIFKNCETCVFKGYILKGE